MCTNLVAWIILRSKQHTLTRCRKDNGCDSVWTLYSQFTRTNVKTTIARRRAAEVVTKQLQQQQQQVIAQQVAKAAEKVEKSDEDRVDPPHTVQSQGVVPSRPPIAPGESGNTFFTNQPFQVLSWYPRWGPRHRGH